MGQFGIGQAVQRFEDPRLLRGGDTSPMSAGRAWPMAMCCARPMRMRGSSRSTRAPRSRCPGVLAVLPAPIWKAVGLGTTAGADAAQAPRRLAALHQPRIRPGERPRALCRRSGRRSSSPRRLAAGQGRGRAHRGRLRAAAGGGSTRRRGEAGRAGGLGRIARTTSRFVFEIGNKAATDAAFAKAAIIVKRRFVINRVMRSDDGAARRARRLRCRARTASPLHGCSGTHPHRARELAEVSSRCRRAASASSPAISAAASA